jgi:hypothetical protein
MERYNSDLHINGLLTAFSSKPDSGARRNPSLSALAHDGAIANRGRTNMKGLILLTAVAVLTLGNAIAAMPGAASSMGAAALVVIMADQELLFDRY